MRDRVQVREPREIQRGARQEEVVPEHLGLTPRMALRNKVEFQSLGLAR